MRARRRRAPECLLGASLAALVVACPARSPDVAAPPPPPPPVGESHAGFDASRYPGDAAMRAWLRPGSPYEWVGYYLYAPCHRDSTWTGTRPRLEAMGWGSAVLYVGQQTFDGLPSVLPAEKRLPSQRVVAAATCSRTLLSADQGTSEADDAIARTAAEGFPPATAIYLDLEQMLTIPDNMRAYYRAWAARILAEAQYRPAIYCHKSNAEAIYADIKAVFAAAGAVDAPLFWIANTTGFALGLPPTAAGYAFASVWQGRLDVTESWAGTTITIDVDVAATASPSRK